MVSVAVSYWGVKKCTLRAARVQEVFHSRRRLFPETCTLRSCSMASSSKLKFLAEGQVVSRQYHMNHLSYIKLSSRTTYSLVKLQPAKVYGRSDIAPSPARFDQHGYTCTTNEPAPSRTPYSHIVRRQNDPVAFTITHSILSCQDSARLSIDNIRIQLLD
jgi:hypothetical protein